MDGQEFGASWLLCTELTMVEEEAIATVIQAHTNSWRYGQVGRAARCG